MRRRRPFLLATLIVALLSAWPAPLAGQAGGGGSSGPPLECCLVLLLPVGGRSAALGRAMTAWGSPDAVFTNPAGLATLERSHLMVHHEPLFGGQQANAISVLVAPRSVGTIGVTYQLYDYGDEEARDASGVTTGRFSTREQILIASYATHVDAGLMAGMNYKLYQFRLDCAGYCPGGDFAGTTHAIDAGVRYHSASIPHLQLGAAIVNLGFALQVVNAAQADPMPARLRVGAAYEILHHFVADSTLALWVTTEVENRLRHPGERQGAVGLELSAGGILFARAGFRTGEGRGTGGAVGVGMNYDRFTVSLSRSFASTEMQLDYEPFQFTLGIAF